MRRVGVRACNAPVESRTNATSCDSVPQLGVFKGGAAALQDNLVGSLEVPALCALTGPCPGKSQLQNQPVPTGQASQHMLVLVSVHDSKSAVLNLSEPKMKH